MQYVEEKLDKFNADIMEEVNEKRRRRLEQVDREIDLTLDKQELEYLEAAYQRIQEGLKQIHREKNAIISKAVLKGKEQLLKERTSIIQRVREQVILKLQGYMATEDYKNYLIREIEEKMANYPSEKQVILYVDAQESDKVVEALIDHFPYEVKRASREEKMIGGFILALETEGIMINGSFAEKLDTLKSRFYEICQLDID